MEHNGNWPCVLDGVGRLNYFGLKQNLSHFHRPETLKFWTMAVNSLYMYAAFTNMGAVDVSPPYLLNKSASSSAQSWQCRFLAILAPIYSTKFVWHTAHCFIGSEAVNQLLSGDAKLCFGNDAPCGRPGQSGSRMLMDSRAQGDKEAGRYLTENKAIHWYSSLNQMHLSLWLGQHPIWHSHRPHFCLVS